MAINKKLIHFKTYQAFNTELEAGNILDTSIVWIKDTQQIYTHGQFYNCTSDSALTILMTGYTVAEGSTEEELTILPTDTLAVAMGKLQKQSLDNEEVVASAVDKIKTSLGFTEDLNFSPTSEQLSGMTVTEAIDWLVTNASSGTDWSAQIGTNTYDGANYISKETNLTDAAMQLDEEIKATNDNLAILNAASLKGVKLAGAVENLAPQTGVVTIPDATTSSNGLMPAADKQKVDGILTDGDGTSFLANDGSYKQVPTELSADYAPSDLTNEQLEPVAGDTFETAIGKLHKAILDNEDVVSQTLVNLQTVLGVENPNQTMPDLSDTNYLNGQTVFVSALKALDAAIKTVADQAATIDDLEARVAALESALTLKTVGA